MRAFGISATLALATLIIPFGQPSQAKGPRSHPARRFDGCVIGAWRMVSVRQGTPLGEFGNISWPFFEGATITFAQSPAPTVTWNVTADLSNTGFVPPDASAKLTATSVGTWSMAWGGNTLYLTTMTAGNVTVRTSSGESVVLPLPALHLDGYNLSWMTSAAGPYMCNASDFVFHSLHNEVVTLRRVT